MVPKKKKKVLQVTLTNKGVISDHIPVISAVLFCLFYLTQFNPSVLECADYYFLYEDECVDDCPKGQFASEQQQECMQCHADCASCDGPGEDDCDVCRNPKAVRYNGECLARCPNNTYYDEKTNECRGKESRGV